MSKRILIADDSAFMRKRIKETLENNGHQVIGEAQDGDEAFVKYGELKPDIVTMDITMRGKDGLTATKEILQAYPEAKVILLTMLRDDEYRNLAQSIGAKGFVVKNEIEEVLNLISKL